MPATGGADLLALGVLVFVFVGMPAAIIVLLVRLVRGGGGRAAVGRQVRRRAAGPAGAVASGASARRAGRADLLPAIAFVQERFARGEISEADYEAALRALGVEGERPGG